MPRRILQEEKMSNWYEIAEIAGSSLTVIGGVLLLIDGIRIRQNIRSEEGALKLLEIMREAHATGVVKDNKGEPLNSAEAIRLWFAAHAIALNSWALLLVVLGFISDLIGKIGKLTH
jgi:hypothetical protein